ncbi:hypothetical protein [Neolewinella antarctica]|uniref:AAA+ ATPase domain-containing protein n=1 Tax=Neolewinella antarctica TaxID=442734 RepID=A0ABX0XCY0_9BACT|nr:hypothetical protein [Neolewinella antarctica]NJC27067.1 hypothetical protein [Neolewinella antarctica]
MTGTTTQPALGELLATLEHDVADRLAATRTPDDSPAELRQVVDANLGIVGAIQAVGRAAQLEIEAGDAGNEVAYYVVYEWLNEARDFLILLRNVVFERHRGQVLVNEGELAADTLHEFDRDSQLQATEASRHLLDGLHEMGNRPIYLKKHLSKWKLEKSPLTAHEGQFAVLVAQIEELDRQAFLLEKTRLIFARIHHHFGSAFDDYLDYLNQLNDSLDASLRGAEGADEPVSARELIKQLRTNSSKTPAPQTVGAFIEGLSALTTELPGETDLIIGTDHGLLQQNELDLGQETSAWLQSELMSEIQDLYNRRNQINNRLLVALRTGENRLEFDQQEDQSTADEEIQRTMQQLVKNLRKSAEGLTALREKTLTILHEEVSVKHAFSPEFLQLNLQQTFSQYRKSQVSGLVELRDWAVGKWQRLVNKGIDSFQSEGLSPAERVVRLVNTRRPNPATSHYEGMFVNSGYLGESFRVGRQRELDRTGEIVKNWTLGFRGAILVTGSRHSGKTFFGEMVGHRYFQNRYVDLRPNERLTMGGRILEPTEDLEEALKFVIANGRGKQRMVLIDDLARWEDRDSPLATDVRGLLDKLDQHAGQLFFVVCADALLYDQLRMHFDVDRYFQATFPMRRLTPQEIGEAIYIRHGATQMQIVDDNGEELSPLKLERLIKTFTYRAHGHVGEGLRQWAYAIRPHDEDSVRVDHLAQNSLDVVLSKDAGILLRAILVDRSTSEYQLRKQFGPLFNDQFQLLIQRYLQLGILVRGPNGMLQILPAVVSDVERELASHGFIPASNIHLSQEI